MDFKSQKSFQSIERFLRNRYHESSRPRGFVIPATWVCSCIGGLIYLLNGSKPASRGIVEREEEVVGKTGNISGIICL